jgi:peptide/nickel transport system substrate-binding protein
MQHGDIDGTFDISISDLNQWEALDNAQVKTTPSLGVYALILDQSAPPFDDIHVRRAVAHAVDREGLVKALLKGKGEAATALNPPQMWSGLMAADEVRAFYATLADYPFDLSQAKAELAKSGHADGFDLSIPASTADPYMINVLQSVVENLKQIGIRAKIEEFDNNAWLAQYFRHEKLGMQIMAYYPDYPDAVSYPYLFFSSSTARKDGLNGSNFKDAKVDALLKIAIEKSDPKERTNALKEVFKIVNEGVPLVPIFWPDSAMALSNKYSLTGYTAFWYNIPWAMRGFGPA